MKGYLRSSRLIQSRVAPFFQSVPVREAQLGDDDVTDRARGLNVA
jgi:hypothetical protein